MYVPDAIFHLMRHTNLKTCDLSFNVITTIPPKLASKFSYITGKFHEKASKKIYYPLAFIVKRNKVYYFFLVKNRYNDRVDFLKVKSEMIHFP